MCVFVIVDESVTVRCVCVWEVQTKRERENERKRQKKKEKETACVCACVCVCEREREIERKHLCMLDILGSSCVNHCLSLPKEIRKKFIMHSARTVPKILGGILA